MISNKMYFQILSCLVLLASNVISHPTEHHHHQEDSILRLHNFTGPLPEDKIKDVKEICIQDSIIDLPTSSYPSYPNIKIFTSKNSKFVKVPNWKWLTCPHLDEIHLDNTAIEGFDLSLCNAYSGLKVLHIQGEKIGTLKANALNNLKELKCLQLANAGITSIEKDAFSGLEDLKNLDLSNNELKSIPKEAFASLKNLEKLVLSHNLFEKFGPEDLPHLPKLKELNLEFNPVKVNVDGLKKVVHNLDNILTASLD